MKISELFQDKYTIVFVLILLLLVSIWVSRTYRNGGFSGWIAPSEGYGTGVIEGLTASTRYIGTSFTATSNPVPTAQVASSAANGRLLLDRCTRVKNTNATFRFLLTTTAG